MGKAEEGNKLLTIGTNSVLDADDAKYIEQCVERLRESGHHTKAIYLEKLISNSRIVESRAESEIGLVDLETMEHIINRKEKNDSSAWEMYSYDVFRHIMHWINNTIINKMRLCKDIDNFPFRIDYDVLFAISQHYPPFHKERGLEIIMNKILRSVSSSVDWEMTDIRCKENFASFTIRKVKPEKTKWWKFR